MAVAAKLGGHARRTERQELAKAFLHGDLFEFAIDLIKLATGLFKSLGSFYAEPFTLLPSFKNFEVSLKAINQVKTQQRMNCGAKDLSCVTTLCQVFYKKSRPQPG